MDGVAHGVIGKLEAANDVDDWRSIGDGRPTIAGSTQKYLVARWANSLIGEYAGSRKSSHLLQLQTDVVIVLPVANKLSSLSVSPAVVFHPSLSFPRASLKLVQQRDTASTLGGNGAISRARVPAVYIRRERVRF